MKINKCLFFCLQRRCSLRPTTLYYGWVVPMSVIILHNLVVFALVMQVLFKKNPVEIASELVLKTDFLLSLFRKLIELGRNVQENC